MKELAGKVFKFLAASVGILVTAYSIGWTGATSLYHLFKTERTEAQFYVKEEIKTSESKIMAVHNADMGGVRDAMNIVIRQNESIMKQNTEILKRLP